MDDKYFFHYIRRTNGDMTKQIDICDTLDEAKQSFRKFFGDYGYGYRADTDYTSAFVTDSYGNIIRPYVDTWIKEGVALGKFFMHRIKHDSTSQTEFVKGIEIHDFYNAAKQSFNAYLGAWAYGQKPGHDFVECRITDTYGAEMMAETWREPEPAPEPNAE